MSATDVDCIRSMLKFLFKANRRILVTADLLYELCTDTDPPGLTELLKPFHFQVGEYTFHGRMTQEQHDYLEKRLESLETFADAIADVLLKLNTACVGALKDLDSGLHASARSQKQNKFTIVPQVGCCIYGAHEVDNVTQTYCEVGLHGHWTGKPCGGKPSDKK